MATPTNLFKNFREFNNIINLTFKDPNYDDMNRNYENIKKNTEMNNVQLFIDNLKENCKKLNYDTDFEKMVDDFNNFSENYIDNKPNDYLTLQTFTCMVSDILKNFSEIIRFENYDSYEFNISKLYEIYDPSVALDIKIDNVKNALSSDFLSRTIFNYKNEVKYLAKGANGGVNLIRVFNASDKFNVIEKYMLDTSDPLKNLFSILREYIVGTQILLDIRPYTPNFTSIYGMYISNGPVSFEFDEKIINDYLSSKSSSLAETFDEYGSFGYYYEIDELKNKTLNMANLDYENKKLYLLTEYSQGISFLKFIEDAIKSNKISKVYSIMEVISQIYRSLIFAHNAIGYVHNDLHAENIMVYEQPDSIYVPEIVILKNPKHNRQKVKNLAQIIDYGYSSINNYVNYAGYLFSDETTTVHTDILRLYTFILKLLYNLVIDGYNNDTLLTLLQMITVCIGSYYFSELSSFDFSTDLLDFTVILSQYYKSGLLKNYEYLPRDVNLKIRSLGLNNGYDFYEYFIDKIQNAPDNAFEKIGFSIAPDDSLYDYLKLENRKAYVPVNDINLENILESLQPEGLTEDQYDEILGSFVNFIKLIDELVLSQSITDIFAKVTITMYIVHNLINYSKTIALNTLLIYYSKQANMVPPELSILYEERLPIMSKVLLNLYDELLLATLPSDVLDDVLEKIDFLLRFCNL